MTTDTTALSDQSSFNLGPTLRDVRKHIMGQSDLATQRKANLLSAINTLCRVLDRPDHQIPTAMNLLRPLLDKAAPGSIHVNPRRWSNIKSDVLAAIRMSGFGGDFIAKDVPITDSWQAIVDRIEADQEKCFMRRFARFCGSRQIAPAAANDALLPSYRAYLDETLSRSPKRCLDDLVRTWNRMAAANPDLNLTTFTKSDRSRAYCLPWSDLPASLLADTIAYKAAMLAPDPLGENAQKKVRQATADQYERMIRRMATAALAKGAAIEEVATLARLVSPATLRRALEFFLMRNNNMVGQQVHDMAHLAQGIARHWARLPEADVIEIRRLAKKCSIKRHGLTQKNRDELQQLRDEAVITKLVNLPRQLLDRAQAGEVNCRTAMMVQTAVALAILLGAPIRIANLRSLDRARHFKPAFSTKSPVMQLVIGAEEVKNSEDLVFPLWPSVMDLIDLYLREYQPLLCGENESSLLFPGRDGRPKSDNKLRDQIEKVVWSNLGIHVHPHLFRHIAALIFLAKYPGQYEVVRRLLGHKSIETTIRFYAGLETTAAVNCYNEIIDGYRNKSDQKKG
jgi:integrase